WKVLSTEPSPLRRASRLSATLLTLVKPPPMTTRPSDRSEEHTSELQSLRHLVCRLLLEKKNKCLILLRRWGMFELVAGGRMRRRATTVRMRNVSPIVRDIPDQNILELVLIEHIHRVDLL